MKNPKTVTARAVTGGGDTSQKSDKVPFTPMQIAASYLEANMTRDLDIDPESGVNVDLIVRKSSDFRQVEFARQPVAIAGIRTRVS